MSRYTVRIAEGGKWYVYDRTTKQHIGQPVTYREAMFQAQRLESSRSQSYGLSPRSSDTDDADKDL